MASGICSCNQGSDPSGQPPAERPCTSFPPWLRYQLLELWRSPGRSSRASGAPGYQHDTHLPMALRSGCETRGGEDSVLETMSGSESPGQSENGNPEALRSVTVPLDSAGTSGFGACWYSANGTQGGFVLSAVYATDTPRVRLRLSDNNAGSPPFFVYP